MKIKPLALALAVAMFGAMSIPALAAGQTAMVDEPLEEGNASEAKSSPTADISATTTEPAKNGQSVLQVGGKPVNAMRVKSLATVYAEGSTKAKKRATVHEGDRVLRVGSPVQVGGVSWSKVLLKGTWIGYLRTDALDAGKTPITTEKPVFLTTVGVTSYLYDGNLDRIAGATVRKNTRVAIAGRVEADGKSYYRVLGYPLSNAYIPVTTVVWPDGEPAGMSKGRLDVSIDTDYELDLDLDLS